MVIGAEAPAVANEEEKLVAVGLSVPKDIGFCLIGLAAALDAEEEPFVAPNPLGADGLTDLSGPFKEVREANGFAFTAPGWLLVVDFVKDPNAAKGLDPPLGASELGKELLRTI